MALEDFAEPEVAATAVVTAAIFSPKARKLLRKGAVYGLAGALIAGETAASFGRSVAHGFQKGRVSTESTPQADEQAATTNQQPPTDPATRSIHQDR
jgi:hypothetical protein